MITTKSGLTLIGLLLLSGCVGSQSESASETLAEETPTVETSNEHVQLIDPRLSELVDPQMRWEVLSDGYQWAEGPTWDRERAQLYFTDVPGNKAYVWKAGVGTQVFLDPSGGERTDGFREPGANGLFYTEDDRVLLANHGARAVQILEPDDKSRETLIDQFEGQRFNSPNDLVQASDGMIYFSDPPYGLEGLNDSPLKELEFNGVYRLSPDGELTLLADNMTFPNGVALSPDERHLYIAQSDPNAPGVFKLDLGGAFPSTPELFFDMTDFVGGEHPGLPDGFAMAGSGDIFVTGPGGIFVLTDKGELLGRIMTESATANVTFGGEEGRTLFITAQDRLLRLPVRAQGAAWK